jgi:hypothetical protein
MTSLVDRLLPDELWQRSQPLLPAPPPRARGGVPLTGPRLLVDLIWARCLNWSCETGASRCRGGRVPRTYDPEFRRRVVELVRAGRPVRVVAAELGLAEATVNRWKAQDLIDLGVKPGTSTSERGELDR